MDIYTETVKSYPDERNGDFWKGHAPIGPGDQSTLTIIRSGFNAHQISNIEAFYVKVDNDWSRPYGLVPECNEMNNLGTPLVLRTHSIYLPVIRR